MTETPLPENIPLFDRYTIFLSDEPFLTGVDVVNVQKTLDVHGNPAITMEFSNFGFERVEASTVHTVEDYMAVVFDSRILFLLQSITPSGGDVEITGLDEEDRDKLYELLTGDDLPFQTWGGCISEVTHANKINVYKEYENGTRVLFRVGEPLDVLTSEQTMLPTANGFEIVFNDDERLLEPQPNKAQE